MAENILFTRAALSATAWGFARSGSVQAGVGGDADTGRFLGKNSIIPRGLLPLPEIVFFGNREGGYASKNRLARHGKMNHSWWEFKKGHCLKE